MIVALFGGLLAGALHVVAGPDHLAAVAPLALDVRERPWRIGLRWGLGHAVGTLVVGALALGLRNALPLEELGIAAERLVGVVLIVLGLWALRRALRMRVHVHQHTHDGVTHEHVHVHAVDAHVTSEAASVHRHGHAATSIGLLHGAAGGSHFLGIVPALALATLTDSVTFLVAFALASVAAMTGYAFLVGLAGRALGGRSARALRLATASVAVASVAVGVFWLAV